LFCYFVLFDFGIKLFSPYMAYIGFTIITPWHAIRQDFQNLPELHKVETRNSIFRQVKINSCETDITLKTTMNK